MAPGPRQWADGRQLREWTPGAGHASLSRLLPDPRDVPPRRHGRQQARPTPQVSAGTRPPPPSRPRCRQAPGQRFRLTGDSPCPQLAAVARSAAEAGWPGTASSPRPLHLLRSSPRAAPRRGRPALTIQRRDAADMAAAHIPCGELQSDLDVRRPFELIHQGQEDFGWRWDLQREQPGGGGSCEERPWTTLLRNPGRLQATASPSPEQRGSCPVLLACAGDSPPPNQTLSRPERLTSATLRAGGVYSS